jgi:hypothetical protein
MKGINHLVIAGHDLETLRSAYQGLGFTLTARGQHPFGTGNTIIQLQGNYLELLSVTIPQDVPEHSADRFSFAAFNRDYLARHEGISMVIFDSPDARADVAAWRKAGLQTYEAVDFSRMAKLPNGGETRVGFSLAFLRNLEAPWLGVFACQHHAPSYYAQPQFQKHANDAVTVLEVWVVGDTAQGLMGFFQVLTGSNNVKQGEGRSTLKTPTGDLVLATPQAFVDAFGVPPANAADAPCLAGLVVGCRSLKSFRSAGLVKAGDRYVVPPQRSFGTALAFAEV